MVDMQVEYLDQLFNLKDTFADDDHRRHHVFFDIMKNISKFLTRYPSQGVNAWFLTSGYSVVLLNDPNLLEVLFSERYILRLVDALERT